MVDSTASLGVDIRVTGAEEGAKKLDQFVLSAKGAANATKELSDIQAKAMNDLVRGSDAIPLAANNVKKLSDSASATGQSMGLIQRAIRAVSDLFRPYGQGAEGATANLNHLAGAHGEVAKGMHLVNAIAYSTGSNIQGIGQFAMLARGGLEVLAAGLTATLIVSLERSADAVKLLQDRFAFFKGETGAKQAMDQIREAADKTGASVSTLGELTQSLSEKLGSQKTGWINPPGMDKAPTIINALNEALVRSGKDADTATGLIKKYADQIGELDPTTNKYLGMTQKLFDQIRKDSPQTAAAIAAAFGHPILDFDKQMGLQRFSEWLKNSPQDVNQLNFAMQRMPAEIAKIKLEPNVSQSWVALKNSVLNLWEELGKSEGGSIAKRTIDGITKSIKELDAQIKEGKALPKIWDMISESFNAPENDLMGQFVTKTLAAIKKQLNDFAEHPFDKTIDWLSLLSPPDGWGVTVSRMIGTIGGYVNGAVDGIIAGINLLIDKAIQTIPRLVKAAKDELAKLFSISGGTNPMGDLAGPGDSATSGVTSARTTGLAASSKLVEMPAEAERATNAVKELETNVEQLGTNGAKSVEQLDNQIAKIGETPISDQALQDFHLATINTAGAIGSELSAIVNAISQSVIMMVRNAESAISQLQASAATAGNYASTQPGVSFDVTGVGLADAGNTVGFATGGTFKVGGSGGIDSTPVTFRATPGEIVSITPVNTGVGSAFRVGGSGGIDSTLVQFSATPGSVVSITPSGLSNPTNSGLQDVSLQSYTPGMPTAALGGKTVVQVPATTATAAAAVSVASSSTQQGNPYTMYPVGGGEIKIKPWKNTDPSIQEKLDAKNFGQVGLSGPNTNAPTDAYYAKYGANQYVGIPAGTLGTYQGKGGGPLGAPKSLPATPIGIPKSSATAPLVETNPGYDTFGMASLFYGGSAYTGGSGFNYSNYYDMSGPSTVSGYYDTGGSNYSNYYPSYASNYSNYSDPFSNSNYYNYTGDAYNQYSPSSYNYPSNYDYASYDNYNPSSYDYASYDQYSPSSYDYASYAGPFQTGGSFKIRGGGPPDSKLVAMRLSPDEHVKISKPNEDAQRPTNVTIQINGNISPYAYLAAEAQVKRAARRIFAQ